MCTIMGTEAGWLNDWQKSNEDPEETAAKQEKRDSSLSVGGSEAAAAPAIEKPPEEKGQLDFFPNSSQYPD